MKAFCVEINTKLFHSPLLSATLSLLFLLTSTTNTLFYARFVVWCETQTAPLFYKITETYHAYLSKHCLVYPFIRHQQL